MAKKFNLAGYLDQEEKETEAPKKADNTPSPKKKEDKKPVSAKNPIPVAEEVKKSEEESTAEESAVPVRRPVGRPKSGGPTGAPASFYLSPDVLQHVKLASFFHNNSGSQYVESLIRADMEANKEKYAQIAELMKSFR
ncbi:MAG: hypothetical protein K5853_05100 [Lachnospiraceae bacterium]|nr:hypothetical protein [Lachnospiraceae bacterium]